MMKVFWLTRILGKKKIRTKKHSGGNFYDDKSILL